MDLKWARKTHSSASKWGTDTAREKGLRWWGHQTWLRCCDQCLVHSWGRDINSYLQYFYDDDDSSTHPSSSSIIGLCRCRQFNSRCVHCIHPNTHLGTCLLPVHVHTAMMTSQADDDGDRHLDTWWTYKLWKWSINNKILICCPLRIYPVVTSLQANHTQA